MKATRFLACALAAIPAFAYAGGNKETWESAKRYYGPAYGILPPLEYDKPYPGALIVIRKSEAEMKIICPETLLPVTLACSVKINAGRACIIIAGDNALIAKGPWPWQVVLRHEIGHCNGWSGDHQGARPLSADKTVSAQRPELAMDQKYPQFLTA